ncbi:hypothetical protein T265_09025 [Opisthorchis viverrini]|uniref:DUF5641 domain-containing protein n=1 Tax=Opisthorchis viverrini TaxID=6198 RepID=A0A074ZBN4_OPIVI|nr:hypothetical protein T265_09025 [Opisthorchis viverrini]KER23017.1 hypothetical protein T265_09025 [Opisthorchis viverrini]
MLDSYDDSVVDVQVDPQDKVKIYLAGIVSSTPIQAFDGNSRWCWRFIQQFKYYIEDRVQDSGQRMLYLIHYCRGPAKEAVAECPGLTPNDLLILNNRVHGVVPESMTERYTRGWQKVNYLTRVFWKHWVKEYIPLLQERYTRGWQKVNYLTRVFWKHWVKEYVPLLQARTKWQKPQRNFRKGDVVLVQSGASSREQWPGGVVDECETSDDGLVKTVVVRTMIDRLRRDVRKIGLIESYE